MSSMGNAAAKWILGAVLAVALVVLPFVLETWISQYYLYLATKIMVWALFATSFNLVLGYGGMMSFGHAAFYGIGAYTCALLPIKWSCPMMLALLAAPLVAAITGLIIGYFSARALNTPVAEARTLAIEVGMQNSGLAVALAIKYFTASAALPGAIFSIWHNLSGSALASIWSKR